ncbi:TPA_asm: protein 3 [Silene virus 1]|uniref:Protein 3 n=1 Tax=Silene virus 1 TaxID=2977989 RepID=A0A9N7AB60_9RHAB|nr:TPA_asm: protein 3 [Silene virus 1]
MELVRVISSLNDCLMPFSTITMRNALDFYKMDRFEQTEVITTKILENTNQLLFSLESVSSPGYCYFCDTTKILLEKSITMKQMFIIMSSPIMSHHIYQKKLQFECNMANRNNELLVLPVEAVVCLDCTSSVLLSPDPIEAIKELHKWRLPKLKHIPGPGKIRLYDEVISLYTDSLVDDV